MNAVGTTLQIILKESSLSKTAALYIAIKSLEHRTISSNFFEFNNEFQPTFKNNNLKEATKRSQSYLKVLKNSY